MRSNLKDSSSSDNESDSDDLRKDLKNYNCDKLFIYNQEKDVPVFFPPEVEKGNVEYKRQLVDIPQDRLSHLTTQMKWRLEEGNGEVIYRLGVEDCGKILGISFEVLLSSIETLKKMSSELKATMYRQNIYEMKNKLVFAEITIRCYPDQLNFKEKIAILLGDVNSGKSTLLGTLSSGKLDDGYGSSRIGLFQHKHEVESGRTSSICKELLGFDDDGELVNWKAPNDSPSWTGQDICSLSEKVITFIDLAGHKKYQKTTLSGMTRKNIAAAILVVAGNAGVTEITVDHFALAVALGLPIIVVITKVDLATNLQLQKTINQIKKLFSMPNYTKESIIIGEENMELTRYTLDRYTPIIPLSCVSGFNLRALTTYICLHIESKEKECLDELESRPEDGLPFFQAHKYYNLDKIGVVFEGFVLSGIIEKGQLLLLGPDSNGKFSEVKVKSLHRKRIPQLKVEGGQTACLCVDRTSLPSSCIRSGVVMTSLLLNPTACYTFEAEILLLSHSSQVFSFSENSEFCLHIGGLRQNVTILPSETSSVEVGVHSHAEFRFNKTPEYLQLDSKFLITQGNCTKAFGKVTRLID